MNAATHERPPRHHAAWKVWDNPIFRRYCRSRLRPRGLAVSLLITVLLAGFIVAMARAIGVRSGMDPADAARAGIIPLLLLQGFILFVLGTAQVAGGMTAERDEGVIDYQRLLPMSPLAKVAGYLWGLPVREHAMFLATVPFAGWSIWRGDVDWRTWLPLYSVFFTSTMLYHFTGLVTGTVVKNRRWAFLTSIGVVFALYTVVPQMARFGLVFFKYLTVTPVFEECLPGLVPVEAGSVLKAGQALMPTVKFFGLDFSEAVFTVFSQGGLILTFVIMLCRKWRRAESHLLGKPWATGFFVWIQLLLLGNALPLIEPGTLFPSRGFARMARVMPGWAPEPMEAVAMSALYGVVTLALVFLLGGIVTPSRGCQMQGWRRARKQGRGSLPVLSDSAAGFCWVLSMALAGATGWFLFSRALVESRWFDGHTLPVPVFWQFVAVMAGAGVGFHALLENKGGRVLGMAAIFAGVLPIMTGAVLGVIDDRLIPVAVWVGGISPVSLPAYAAGSLLPISDLPDSAARAVPRAFQFWSAAMLLTAGWLVARLRAARAARANDARAVPVVVEQTKDPAA